MVHIIPLFSIRRHRGIFQGYILYVSIWYNYYKDLKCPHAPKYSYKCHQGLLSQFYLIIYIQFFFVSLL